MEYSNILVERLDRVARLTLNRPEKLNALSEALMREMDDALVSLDDDAGVSVIILRGAGRAFCAGYDITPDKSGFRTKARKNMDITGDRERLRRLVTRWFNAIWDLRTPVIAQVHGHCLAGGSELAMMCDLVVAADDARIGHPAVRAMGTPPTNIYPYIMGLRKAKEMVLTGEVLTGVRAAELGVVNYHYPAEELERTTLELAQRIARTPKEMLALNKMSVNKAFEVMGIRLGAHLGVEYDAMGHFTRTAFEFWEVAERDGLKAALDRRDKPFGKS